MESCIYFRPLVICLSMPLRAAPLLLEVLQLDEFPNSYSVDFAFSAGAPDWAINPQNIKKI